MHIIWQLIFCHPYVNLNFCLNRRTPSYLTSMEVTREKTRCPWTQYMLSLSRWMNQLGTMQLAILQHCRARASWIPSFAACMSDGLTYSESLTAGRPVSSPHPILPSFAPPACAIHSLNYNAPCTRPCTAPSMRRPQPLHAQPAAIASGRAPARAGRRHRCRPRPCLARAAGAAAGRATASRGLQPPLSDAPAAADPMRRGQTPACLPLLRSLGLEEEWENGRVRGGGWRDKG